MSALLQHKSTATRRNEKPLGISTELRLRFFENRLKKRIIPVRSKNLRKPVFRGVATLGGAGHDRVIVSRDPIGFAGGDVNLWNYTSSNPINYIDPFGLRDVIVVIWGRKISEGSVGHVVLAETNGQIITSSFPTPHGMHGINTTKSWWDTASAEGRAPTEVFKVFVPDDKAFNDAAALERGRKSWDWRPNDKDETNCTVAAYRSLKKGKVKMPTPWVKPWSPDDLIDALIRLSITKDSGVIRLGEL